MAAKNHGSTNFEIWQHLCIQSLAMTFCFDQQHEPMVNGQNWWIDPRWWIKIGFFSITLEVTKIFQSVRLV
jgi:hypothetical protein